MLDLVDSSRVNLTQDPAVDTSPAWSPDGTRIAFRSERDGNPEINLMEADGSNPVRLTFDSGNDDELTWSPDGQKIAFLTDRDGNNEIYVMNADGSGPVSLTQGLQADYSPAWSHDGSRIALGSSREDAKYVRHERGRAACAASEAPCRALGPRPGLLRTRGSHSTVAGQQAWTSSSFPWTAALC